MIIWMKNESKIRYRTFQLRSVRFTAHDADGGTREGGHDADEVIEDRSRHAAAAVAELIEAEAPLPETEKPRKLFKLDILDKLDSSTSCPVPDGLRLQNLGSRSLIFFGQIWQIFLEIIFFRFF